MSEEQITGACLCGAIEFEVSFPTLFCAHCHCTMCQRGHGAGYVTWFGVPEERFHIVKGDDQLVRYDSSDHGTRSFCGTCGSSMFCQSTHQPGVMDIVLANMHGALDRAPSAHVYWSDRAEWVSVDPDTPRRGGESGSEPLPEE